MGREIGSEFSLIPNNEFVQDSIFSFLSDFTLFESGRAALRAVLAHIVSVKKAKLNVLLPAYICESVVLPFEDYHFNIFFYSGIKSNDEGVIDAINKYDIDVVFHLDYFGVNQWKIKPDTLKEISALEVILIEDITHSLFNERQYQESDYYIASVRKWFGTASGGAAFSKKTFPKYDYKPSEIIELRKVALALKQDYLETNDLNVKSEFLAKFALAEQLLDTRNEINGIDPFSIEVLKKQSVCSLITKRQANYSRLEAFFIEYLPDMLWFEPVDSRACPLFFLVKVSSQRNKLRQYLASKGVYCPIHWPIPDLVESFNMELDLEIYDNVLSIPCDQRYSSCDMDYIIALFKQFYELNSASLINE